MSNTFKTTWRTPRHAAALPTPKASIAFTSRYVAWYDVSAHSRLRRMNAFTSFTFIIRARPVRPRALSSTSAAPVSSRRNRCRPRGVPAARFSSATCSRIFRFESGFADLPDVPAIRRAGTPWLHCAWIRSYSLSVHACPRSAGFASSLSLRHSDLTPLVSLHTNDNSRQHTCSRLFSPMALDDKPAFCFTRSLTAVQPTYKVQSKYKRSSPIKTRRLQIGKKRNHLQHALSRSPCTNSTHT